MDREIKFKYIFKRKFDDRLYGEIYQIALFEEAITNPPNPVTGMLNNNKWGIIARLEYTGLKDKNGNESFESDYIKSEFGIEGIIIFDLGAFSVDIKKIGEKSMYDIASKPCLFDMGDFEIIGNIYEGIKNA